MQVIPVKPARPFITHHNALIWDMYLRIAPEPYPALRSRAVLNAVLRS